MKQIIIVLLVLLSFNTSAKTYRYECHRIKSWDYYTNNIHNVEYQDLEFNIYLNTTNWYVTVIFDIDNTKSFIIKDVVNKGDKLLITLEDNSFLFLTKQSIIFYTNTNTKRYEFFFDNIKTID